MQLAKSSILLFDNPVVFVVKTDVYNIYRVGFAVQGVFFHQVVLDGAFHPHLLDGLCLAVATEVFLAGFGVLQEHLCWVVSVTELAQIGQTALDASLEGLQEVDLVSKLLVLGLLPAHSLSKHLVDILDLLHLLFHFMDALAVHNLLLTLHLIVRILPFAALERFHQQLVHFLVFLHLFLGLLVLQLETLLLLLPDPFFVLHVLGLVLEALLELGLIVTLQLFNFVVLSCFKFLKLLR